MSGVRELFAQAMEKLGHLDLYVNNSGITRKSDFLETTEDFFDRMVDVDLKSAYFCVQAAAREMVCRDTKGSIVIITSNAEKELPDAFLRRCIFHYIAFPTQEQMEKIIRVHFDKLDETLLAQAMQAFYWLRSIDSIEKKPSTSELVDWLRALELGGVDPARIAKDIPFAGVLLKKDKDITAMQRRMR